MPVRYDIAAQIPQVGGGQDPMNMLAQYQMLGYRQQQNALAQMQMQKLQQELEAQQAIRGMAGGINMNDPRVVNQIWAQDPEFARQVYASQLAGQRESRMAEQAAASAANIRAEQALRQREFEELKLPKSQLESEKLGLEKQKLGAEITREERAGRKLDFEINKEALDRDAKMLERLENQAAKIYNMNGRGYEDFYRTASKQNEAFAKMLPPQYDADALAGFIETASSTRDRLKSAGDYDLREIQGPSGATRIVAIPKKAPQMGAVPVPGAEGAKPADYGFMAGPPDSGLVTRTNPRTGQAELITPIQPGAAALPPAQPGAAVQPATGRLIPSEIRPTPEAPVGSAAYNNKRFATEVLDTIGFNAETGEDRVSKLIQKSTGGGLQKGGAGVRAFFGGTSPGMAALAEIKPIVRKIVLDKMNGKLGAGISNEDREFITGLAGNVENPDLPVGERLAAWNSFKSIMMKYANTGGTPAATGARANRPSLDEIFK
jgi:hypothetical protein